MDVAALGGGGLDAQDLLQHDGVVLDQLRRPRTTCAPITTCTRPARFSVRYSILPALISSTAFAISNVIVPLRGLGILPCGPSTRPSRPTTAIMSGVASATSKSVQPSCTRVREIVGAHVVGAGLLGRARVLALGEHGDRLRAARAVRQHQRAAQLLVGVAHVERRGGSAPRRPRRTWPSRTT